VDALDIARASIAHEEQRFHGDLVKAIRTAGGRNAGHCIAAVLLAGAMLLPTVAPAQQSQSSVVDPSRVTTAPGVPAKPIRVNLRVLRLAVDQAAECGPTAESVLASAGERASLSVQMGARNEPMFEGSANMPAMSPATVSGKTGVDSAEAFVRALSSCGTVARVSSSQVVAYEGRPTPLQVVDDVTYFAVSSTGLLKLAVRAGLTASFTPWMVGVNGILLDYSLTIAGRSVATQLAHHAAFVKQGDALVLVGVDQERTPDIERASATTLQGGGQKQLTVIVMEVASERT
jgi:hypothetical protein